MFLFYLFSVSELTGKLTPVEPESAQFVQASPTVPEDQLQRAPTRWLQQENASREPPYKQRSERDLRAEEDRRQYEEQQRREEQWRQEEELQREEEERQRAEEVRRTEDLGWGSGYHSHLPPLRPGFDPGLVPRLRSVGLNLTPKVFPCVLQFFSLSRNQLSRLGI